MNQTTKKQNRILAIAPSARGFGYAVMEGDLILECGNKRADGDINLQAISKIEKLMKQFLPGVLVLQDVNAKGSHRAPRIKALHRQIVKLAVKQKCKITLFSGEKLRICIRLRVEHARQLGMLINILPDFPVLVVNGD